MKQSSSAQAEDSSARTRETGSVFNANNLAAYTSSSFSPQVIQISTAKGMHSVLEVHQDEGFVRLTAKENNTNALFTQGIATCIAICLLNLECKIMSLSHISFILDDFDTELQEELKFLGQSFKVILITNPSCADEDTGLSEKERHECRALQVKTIETIKQLLRRKNPSISIEETCTLTGSILITLDGVLEDISDSSYLSRMKY